MINTKIHLELLSLVEKLIVNVLVLFNGQETVVVLRVVFSSIGNVIQRLACHLFNVVNMLDIVEFVLPRHEE